MKPSTKKIVEFAKWLEKEGKKNWGKKCKRYNIGCLGCRLWRIFEEIEGLANEYKILDK